MADATAADVLAGRADWALETGDAREWVWNLPRNCVHCVVTSPPYWGQRDYGVGGQIGLEDAPEKYIDELVELFRGVRRALHPSGTLWLNLGDKMLDKQMLGIPWRVAFALQADGWFLRQHCPWVCRNKMPESVDDRPATATEEVFLLTKSPDYFFDAEAVKRVSRSGWRGTDFLPDSAKDRQDTTAMKTAATGASRANRSPEMQESRNFRNADLWFDSVGMLIADGQLLGFDVPVKGSSQAHFAMMPRALARPMILAGTSERGVCRECGAPWQRVTERERVATRPGRDTKVTGDSLTDGNRDPERHITRTKTLGWKPGCECFRPLAEQLDQSPHRTVMQAEAGSVFPGGPIPPGLLDIWAGRGWIQQTEPAPIPAVVMDPFGGGGTTLVEARDRGRRAISVELNPEYAAAARARIANVTPGIF